MKEDARQQDPPRFLLPSFQPEDGPLPSLSSLFAQQPHNSQQREQHALHGQQPQLQPHGAQYSHHKHRLERLQPSPRETPQRSLHQSVSYITNNNDMVSSRNNYNDGPGNNHNNNNNDNDNDGGSDAQHYLQQRLQWPRYKPQRHQRQEECFDLSSTTLTKMTPDLFTDTPSHCITTRDNNHLHHLHHDDNALSQEQQQQQQQQQQCFFSLHQPSPMPPIPTAILRHDVMPNHQQRHHQQTLQPQQYTFHHQHYIQTHPSHYQTNADHQNIINASNHHDNSNNNNNNDSSSSSSISNTYIFRPVVTESNASSPSSFSPRHHHHHHHRESFITSDGGIAVNFTKYNFITVQSCNNSIREDDSIKRAASPNNTIPSRPPSRQDCPHQDDHHDLHHAVDDRYSPTPSNESDDAAFSDKEDEVYQNMRNDDDESLLMSEFADKDKLVEAIFNYTADAKLKATKRFSVENLSLSLRHNYPPTDQGSNGDPKREGPWTEEEHNLFLLGVKEYGWGKWREIAQHCIKTRTRVQVATHAHKFLSKVKRTKFGKKKRKRIGVQQQQQQQQQEEEGQQGQGQQKQQRQPQQKQEQQQERQVRQEQEQPGQERSRIPPESS